MKTLKLDNNFDLTKIIVEDSDYKKILPDKLANIAFELFLIREFEQTLLKLSADGCIHGPVHTSIGHEACAAGAMSVLEKSDKVSSTHRAHHHYLSKAFGFHCHNGFNILKDTISQPLQVEITNLMGEIMGLSIGCCGGRGGSMHLRNEKIGVLGTNAIVAGGVPLATGSAFAEKYNKTNNIVVSFLGDGAVNQGAFHEALNLAGIWKLPAVYFIENNLYAVATSIRNSTATPDLVVKAIAYGIKGIIVDGMDPVAVHLGLQKAAQTAREGNGATLIEAKCYRFFHHAGPIPGSNFGYRVKEEESNWQCLDPYAMFPQKLVELKILSDSQIEQLKQKAVDAVHTALNFCTVTNNNKLCVQEKLWPDVSTIKEGIRGSGREFDGVKFTEKEDFSDVEQKTYVEAISSVTGRWLEKDNSVFVVGEEIANFGGGPYGATKGLPAKYPDRVLNTPISESGFVGLGGGAAMSGLKPIIEIMFPDFALVAADQLFNQIGKLRHMYGNSTNMPVVLRTRIAIGCGYGGQHSMDPVGIFSLFSGWTIVAPSNAYDYIGLFNSAMQSKDPVVVIEHHELYPTKCDVPKDNLDYFVPFGKAKVVNKGSDVTVLSYSKMINECQKAAENLKKQGVSVELIDLRTISPYDIDYETIGQSFKKTKMLVIVEQAPKGLSIGSRIAEHCQAEFFDYLDGPITTISGLDIPNPVSKKLESVCSPSLNDIQETIFKAAKRKL
jgi:2-oxoisovalerate dehydrogenase E1 component